MTVLVPVERIVKKIYLIRGQKVMLDSDLADLYDVSTKILKSNQKEELDLEIHDGVGGNCVLNQECTLL